MTMKYVNPPTDYVDAGEAINHTALSDLSGTAPATSTVNYDRILKARSEPENWLTYYGAYDGQRYSLLDQINTENVKKLSPAWIFQAGSAGQIAGASTYAFETCPLIVDGVMYVTGWDGHFWALDAATGKELWRYKHAVPFDVPLCCGNVNRGCAVANGKVYFVTPNAQLLALDATNGETVWKRTIGDVRAGESASLAPTVIKDMLITGSAGGEFGVRGHIDCWDLETVSSAGAPTPCPSPENPAPRPGPMMVRHGSAAVGTHWVTGTFDPETNLY